jgi:hypothetical protein
MRRVLFFTLAMLAAFVTSPGAAETTQAELKVGAQVRITPGPVDGLPFVGRVLGLDDESLLVEAGKGSEPLAVPLRNIELLEVRQRERGSSALRGLFIGTLVGVVLGGFANSRGSCNDPCFDVPGDGVVLAAGAAVGAVTGGVIGAGTAPVRSWRPVPLAVAGRPLVQQDRPAPLAGGIQVTVRF